MSARVARIKVSDQSNHKILSSKQMLQRLSIALSQVRAGNTSEKLLNEIIKIKFLCNEQKKLLKKCATI